MKLWDEEKIFKIVSEAGFPLFLDEWTESSSRKGFARVYVLRDIAKLVCPGAKIRVKGNLIWQQFSYEELTGICYSCGKLEKTLESCACSKDEMHIYGPWFVQPGCQSHKLNHRRYTKLLFRLLLVYMLHTHGRNQEKPPRNHLPSLAFSGQKPLVLDSLHYPLIFLNQKLLVLWILSFLNLQKKRENVLSQKFLSEKRSFISPLQSKVLILEESNEKQDQIHTSSTAIVPTSKSSSKEIWRPIRGATSSQGVVKPPI
ncbi:hypothetical protein COCNU_06G004510 [Cocos nucifera]|uniref:Uncharacterized protein n=1 Tax=Cocos nucifera TaxID=13894 RepID=A0A8K0IBB4_COCNU|nr:hypothetical protein COCNU_06G004510 [Cocos nucifera]